MVSEPPPEFTWVHHAEGEMSNCERWSIRREEYQGGSTTTLTIHHASTADAGTFTLEAKNRNGAEKVDLDLIVLDNLPDCECDMFLRGDKMCTCNQSYTG